MKVFSSVSRLGKGATRKVVQAVAFSILLLACLPLFAQTNQGTIQGGVYDQSGGAIAGATVDVVDVARGISLPFTTDSAGQYVAVNAIPGTYTVRAQAKGFQTLEHTNVVVQVGQTIRVDLTLQPGAQTQTVTVTAEALEIDTTDAVMGGTLTNQQVNSVPLDGRNFLKILDLRPGAVMHLGKGEGNGNADQTSFNGLRTQSNLYLIEGLPQFAPAGSSEIGGSTAIFSIDAIQEMNTEQNPKAEYGWKDGGVIDIGVKSGTNSLHGTAYAFGRDESLDASNYFTGLTPLAMEQFGGSVGGRIIKDKLFWFVNYEGLRETVGTGTLPTVPSDIALSAAQDSTNELSMVNACNAILASGKTISPLSARLAGLTGISSTTGTGSCAVTPASSTIENVFPSNPNASTAYNPNLLNSTSSNNGIAKVDYQLNQHNHFSGLYYTGHQTGVAFGSGYGAKLLPTSPDWAVITPNLVSMYSADWVWTPNSRWVNELRGGRAALDSELRHIANSSLPSLPWPNGYGMPTGVTNPLFGGMPTVTIGGFTGQLGAGSFGGTKGPEGNIDIVDHVSYLRGKHTFKFGGEYIYEIFVGDTFKNAQGTVAFTNLQSFLTGTPKSGSILVGDPALNAGNKNIGLFVQDDWRLTTRLTLNLGLRYEYSTPPKEQHNYLGNFYPNVNPATTSALGQAGGPFPTLYNAQAKQFSPRLGMAWDVKGNGRTVVRASGGLYYAIAAIGDNIDTSPFGANIPSIGYNTSGTAINAHTPTNFSVSALQLASGWNLAGPIFPVTAPTTLNRVTYTGVTCTSASPCPNIGMDPNMLTPRTAEWNVDVQHAITNNLTVAVAYVGNYGYDQLNRNDINQPAFGSGWNNPISGTVSTIAFNGLSPAALCLQSAQFATPYSNCLSNKNVLAAVTANEVAARPFNSKFPYLNYLTTQRNQFYSHYNGLQVTVTERASHGLNFLASYTHDSALNFVQSGGWAGPYSQDINNIKADYGPGGYDIKNHFTFTTTYNLPGIKSPGQMLQGWVLNGIVTMQGGIPWNPQDQTSDLQGTGEYTDPNSPASQYWNYSGPASAFTTGPHNIPCFGNLAACTPYVNNTPPAACASAAVAPYTGNAQLQGLAMAALTNLGCYMQGGGVLTPPAFGTIGNATRGLFHSQPFYNVDFSIFKEWKYKERYTAEFRAEFFNLFNRPDFVATPTVIDPESGLGFGCTCLTPDAQQGDPVFGAGGPRNVQLGLKFIF
jgi:hypothetical protein